MLDHDTTWEANPMLIFDEITDPDCARIMYIKYSRGHEAAIQFLYQARACYRAAALASKRKYGRGGAYRSAYIRSYRYHKQLIDYGEQHWGQL